MNKPLIIIFGMVIALLSYQTIQRNKVWRNSVTLWADALRVDQDNYLAMFNLAHAYAERGDADPAVELYGRILNYPGIEVLNPKICAGSWLNLGGLMVQKKDFTKALCYYSRILMLPGGESPVTQTIVPEAARVQAKENMEIVLTYLAEKGIQPESLNCSSPKGVEG